MSARNVVIILVGVVLFGSLSYFFFTEAIPSLLEILVYSDLTSIVTRNELGRIEKLSILFMKSFVFLIYDWISLTRGCR